MPTYTHGRPTVCDHCGGQLTPHVPGDLCLPCRGELGLAQLDANGDEVFDEPLSTLTAAQARALRFYGTPQPRSAHPDAGGMPRWDVVDRLLERGLLEPAGDPTTTFDRRLTEAGRNTLRAEAARRGWSLPWHRHPYVGEGADDPRRSAEIDRTEADTLDRVEHAPGIARLLASAARWEQQATELEARS